MTFWTVTHTNRFNATVAIACICDLVSEHRALLLHGEGDLHLPRLHRPIG